RLTRAAERDLEPAELGIVDLAPDLDRFDLPEIQVDGRDKALGTFRRVDGAGWDADRRAVATPCTVTCKRGRLVAGSCSVAPAPPHRTLATRTPPPPGPHLESGHPPAGPGG